MGDLKCRHCGQRIVRRNYLGQETYRHQPAGSSFQDGEHLFCHVTEAAPAPADPEGGRVVSGHCEIAECMDCRPRLPQPFRDGDTAGRDTWAKAHSNGTGHTVITYHEPFEVVFGGTGIGVVTPIERGDFDE